MWNQLWRTAIKRKKPAKADFSFHTVEALAGELKKFYLNS